MASTLTVTLSTDMSFRFDPAPQLDLEAPLRVEFFIPLDLLHRFDPSIEPVSTPGHIDDVTTPQNPLKALKPAAGTIAELVSTAIFNSTEAIRHNLQVVGLWETDGTLGAIMFCLHHRLGVDDVGLDPEYIAVFATEDDDGGLVLVPKVLTGERRKRRNEQADGV